MAHEKSDLLSLERMSRCGFDKDGNGIPLRRMLTDQREVCKYDKCVNLLEGHVFSLTLNMQQGGQRAG